MSIVYRLLDEGYLHLQKKRASVRVVQVYRLCPQVCGIFAFSLIVPIYKCDFSALFRICIVWTDIFCSGLNTFLCQRWLRDLLFDSYIERQ